MLIARVRFGLLLALVLVCATPLLAQRAESQSSLLFPTVDRVFADFPDDPHRWAAMRALYEESMKRQPDGTYKASYEKSSSYQLNIGLLEQKYSLPAYAAQSKDFLDRTATLRNDRNFKQQVLDKYGISALKTGTKKDFEQNAKSPEQLMRDAFPYWVATLVLMWFAARYTARGGRSLGTSASVTGGDLPTQLRTVEVLGRQYPVELDSGIVLDERSWVETTTTHTITPGQVITVNDQMISIPAQQSSSTSSVRQDRICLADQNGRQTFWQLSGGAFDCLKEHVVSRIGVPQGDQVLFLMACNHTTGQVVTFPAGVNAQHSGRFLFPWFVATVVGTAGFFFFGWSFIGRLNPEETFAWNAAAYAILCFIGSIITAFMMAFWAGGRVTLKRNKLFYKNWVPKYREFFKQYTPAVVARFRRS